MKQTIAFLLMAAASVSTQAAFTGDVTGGGVFSDSVASADGWSTDSPAGNGVDFWTIDVGEGFSLSVDISSDIEFGISVYEGAVQDDLGFAFDNDADWMDPASGETGYFVAGTPTFGGAGSSLEDIFLANAGTYTIAVGGDDFALYGAPYDYEMSVEAVPLPAAFYFFATGLFGLAARKYFAKK